MSVTVDGTTDTSQMGGRWPKLQPIPPRAAAAWQRLRRALEELAPLSPVCWLEPEKWFAAKGTRAQAEAVEWCLSCPVRVPCASYAFDAVEPEGVWGGLTPAHRGAEA